MSFRRGGGGGGRRRALRSGGSAGGVTGRPRDPRGSASCCPGEIPREPGPRRSYVRAAAKELAAVASRPAVRSAVPSGPGAGQGGCRLGSGEPRREGRVGAGSGPGRVRAAGGGPWRSTGPGVLGGAACHRARAGGQSAVRVSPWPLSKSPPRFGEISSVIWVTGAICSGRATVRGRS